MRRCFLDCRLLFLWLIVGVMPLASFGARADEAADLPDYGRSDSLVVGRMKREKAVENNPSVLLAHRRNYFLPLTWAREPNNTPFQLINNGSDESLDRLESQFQLSLKTSLASGLVFEQDTLFLGFTVLAFWQSYNSNISAPFRESIYEPEVFWITPVPWRVLGGDAALFGLGISHQSNGRIQPLSRSWNRIYTQLIWERSRFVFSLKPWWRIPERKKTDPLQASGDDNPDIEEYLGFFEFSAVHRKQDHEFSVMLRNNLKIEENRATIQLDYTFPIRGRARGYALYFNGYGESLIDYNVRIERLGIGILLSDLL